MSESRNLLDTLRTWRVLSEPELLQRLAMTKADLLIELELLDEKIVSRGQDSRTAYAALRDVKADAGRFPLYQVDRYGEAREIARLEAIYPQGCVLLFANTFEWPLEDEMIDGWFRGLPYPLEDMSPQGFLGKNFAQQFASVLHVPTDLQNWSEDDVLHALSVHGLDLPGNLILGEQSFRHFLRSKEEGQYFLTDDDVSKAYPALASCMAGSLEDMSLMGGEFPKFTARRERDGQYTHVLVKFSDLPISEPELRRADLLVCEHLASKTILEILDIPVAYSRIYQIGTQTFYEIERFDRHGEHGRSGVCSWASLNAALFGLVGPWTAGADALLQRKLITSDTAERIHLLWHFGKLIGNTDMHDGNLSFLPGLELAPAYDMLPMMYAQLSNEKNERAYTPISPPYRDIDVWKRAAFAAASFWSLASNDKRVSEGFRKICGENHKKFSDIQAQAESRAG